MGEARILLMDIENTPNVAYTWGKYQQDVHRFKKEWWMLCFGWKWLGEKKVHVPALPDYPGYARHRDNDKRLVTDLHRLLDMADVVVAHNGDGFDLPKARARFLVHGLKPPSSFKSVDTLKIARRHFMFNSNKLGDLGETLGLGVKEETGGFDTWLGCMAGDPAAWTRMIRYCRQDIVLLEKIYERLLPWIDNHPNMALIEGRPKACPTCGVEGSMQARGLRHFGVTSKRQWRCGACGHYSHSRVAEKTRPDFTG